jgi:hypothetical protein
MITTMSDIRTEFVDVPRKLLRYHTHVSTFFASYQKLWQRWRDSEELHGLNKVSSDAFDLAFTAADCYRPASDYSAGWNIGIDKSHSEISQILQDMKTL